MNALRVALFVSVCAVLSGQTISTAPNAISTVLTANVGISDTSLSVAVCSKITAGQTLNADQEFMLVTAVNACALTVVRALNGSAAARHYANGVISAYTVTARGIFTPQMFGAYGNGIHDDTIGLQACVNRASAVGGLCYVSYGTYLLNTASSGIVIRLPVPTCPAQGCGFAITGGGSGSTILKTALTGVDLMSTGTISTPSTLPQINLSGFTLQGPDNGTTTTSGSGLVMNFDGNNSVCIGCLFTDIKAYDFNGSGKSGMFLSGFQDGTFTGLQVQRSDRGFTFTGNFNSNTVNSLLASNNSSIGRLITGFNTNTWNAMVIQNNKKIGDKISNGSTDVYNSPHYEENNTSHTGGVFTLDINDADGPPRYLNFYGPSFAGTHEKLGLTATVTGWDFITFSGGQNNVSNLVASNGANGRAVFLNSVARADITDPGFAIITCTQDANMNTCQYPNAAQTGYLTTGGGFSFTTGSLNFGTITASGTAGAWAQLSATITSPPNVIQPGDAVTCNSQDATFIHLQVSCSFWVGGTVGILVSNPTNAPITPAVGPWIIRVMR